MIANKIDYKGKSLQLKICAKLLVVLTIVLLLTSCTPYQRPPPPASPIDLSTAKSIPAGETVVFGRVKVIVNEKPFIWDDPRWDKFHLYLLPDSGSEPVVYTLAHDGSFNWHLLPGRYTITSFKWYRGSNYLLRLISASFSVPEQVKPIYIGTLVIKLTQTGARGYPQSSWRLPRDFPLMHIEDDYRQALQGLRHNIPRIKGDITKNLMRLENTR